VNALLVAIVVAALAVGGYVKLRAHDALDQLTAKKAALAEELRAIESVLDRQGEMKAEQEAARARVERLARLIPADPAASELQATLALVARANGLVLIKFKPKDEVVLEHHQETPIETQVEGPYAGLSPYLDSVRALPRLLRVGDLKIDRQRSGSHRMAVEITAFSWPEKP
jgi:type IV pilus assembly protein PilO